MIRKDRMKRYEERRKDVEDTKFMATSVIRIVTQTILLSVSENFSPHFSQQKPNARNTSQRTE